MSSYIDARGAQQDFDILASAGIHEEITVEDDGAAYDLSSTSIYAILKDDREQARDYGTEFGTEETISMTISNAASGIFTFLIPYTYFTNKEGGRLTYEMYFVEGSVRTGRMWGYINVQERG